MLMKLTTSGHGIKNILTTNFRSSFERKLDPKVTRTQLFFACLNVERIEKEVEFY